MTDDGVTLDPERSDTPDAVAMQDAFAAELAERYPARDGEPALSVPPVDPETLVPPDGAWIVVRRDGRPVGCGGLRRIDGSTCEIKRVYLAPEARGLGLSRRLMEDLHERALGLGYRTVRLDTGSAQHEAFGLYSALGYREIEDYNGNHLASFWFEREL